MGRLIVKVRRALSLESQPVRTNDGGRIRTYDLQLMRLASYLTAPLRVVLVGFVPFHESQ
jgi:hypothetical protein